MDAATCDKLIDPVYNLINLFSDRVMQHQKRVRCFQRISLLISQEIKEKGVSVKSCTCKLFDHNYLILAFNSKKSILPESFRMAVLTRLMSSPDSVIQQRDPHWPPRSEPRLSLVCLLSGKVKNGYLISLS